MAERAEKKVERSGRRGRGGGWLEEVVVGGGMLCSTRRRERRVSGWEGRGWGRVPS